MGPVMLGSTRKHAFGEVAAVKKKKVYHEAQAQMEVVKWCREQGMIVLRIENAAKRKYGVARDYALGLQVGAPDLLVFVYWTPVFLEMKSETGRLQREQIDLHRVLRTLDQLVLTGYGATDAIEKLQAAKVIIGAALALRKETVPAPQDSLFSEDSNARPAHTR